MPGPGSDVRDAVPVKVAHACHGGAEVVVVAQGGAVCTVAFYDRGSLYAAVMIHEHHVHGAPVVPSGVVPGRAGSDVRYAVPVKVVYACHGGAEVVTVGQVGTVGGVVVYLHGARYPAVIVHEKQVHGAPVFPPGVVPGRAGSYVDYAVSIQVPYLLHVPSQGVTVGKIQIWPAALRVHDRRITYKAVPVRDRLAYAHHVHCPGVASTGCRRPHGKRACAVAVRIPQQRDVCPKFAPAGDVRPVRGVVVYL